jgi:hypothetical protein
MTDTPKQLVDEEEMQTMSVAPPDPETDEAKEAAGEHSGVADADPLSAHPS